MAQQTINVGTSPNDGTGTPLRTAFQYTNSNFSELYTAVGPSGNNIVVPGNATITGDLTVDTSTLKVDSANDRVGVGLATPGYKLHVQGSAGLQLVLQTNNTDATAKEGTVSSRHYTNAEEPVSVVGSYATSTNNYLYVGGGFSGGNAATSIGFYTAANSTTVTGTERYSIASDGVATWSNVGGVAGTAMTLNSTGLGVGASPNYGFELVKTSPTIAATSNSTTGYSSLRLRNTATSGRDYEISLGGSGTGAVAAGNLYIYDNTAAAVRLLLDSSGNVGVGVTPKTWSTGSVIEVGNYFMKVAGSGTFGGAITNNAYYNSGWKYVAANNATFYQSLSGEHRWLNAPSGTADAAITFTQAMTLDASGYLLIGTTDTAFTSGAGYKFGPGTTPSSGQVGASSSNGDLTHRVYSTGAAAYRFYVGYGGTVFATNTTISAISDTRFKENVQDIDVGLGAILALKPRKFDWKSGKGKDIKGDRGFIAQEFEQVFPQLVDEWADPAPEGEAPYKSVRQDLIPVLVKAIQELAAEVNALKNA